MIRIFRYWVLGVVGLLLSSCSWLTTFVVINATDTAASVTYAISFDQIEKSDCPPLLFFGEPRMAKLDQMWKLADQREFLPKVDYKCDMSTRSISLNLPPGHAVAISGEVNFTGRDTRSIPFCKAPHWLFADNVAKFNIAGNNSLGLL